MERIVVKITAPSILLADDNLMLPVLTEDKKINYAFLGKQFAPIFDKEFLSVFSGKFPLIDVQGGKLDNDIFIISSLRPQALQNDAPWIVPGRFGDYSQDPAMRAYLDQQRASDYQHMASGCVSKIVWTDYPDTLMFRFLHTGSVHRSNGEITAVGNNPYVKATDALARAFISQADPYSFITCFLAPDSTLLGFLDNKASQPMLYTASQTIDLRNDCAAPINFQYGTAVWNLRSQDRYQSLLSQIDQYNWRDQLLMDLLRDRDKDKALSLSNDRGQGAPAKEQPSDMRDDPAKKRPKSKGKGRLFRWLGTFPLQAFETGV